jgi:hypothetical protein
MILSQATNGNTEYEIYDIGNNAISAGYLLGKIGADWQFAGLGGFTAGANCRPAARQRGPRCASAEGFPVPALRAGAVLPLARRRHGVHWRVHGAGRFQHHPLRTVAIPRSGRDREGVISTTSISDLQRVPWPRWLRPGEFAAGADDPAGER